MLRIKESSRALTKLAKLFLIPSALMATPLLAHRVNADTVRSDANAPAPRARAADSDALEVSGDASAKLQIPDMKTFGPFKSWDEAVAFKKKLEKDGWTCQAFPKKGKWWVQGYKR